MHLCDLHLYYLQSQCNNHFSIYPDQNSKFVYTSKTAEMQMTLIQDAKEEIHLVDLQLMLHCSSPLSFGSDWMSNQLHSSIATTPAMHQIIPQWYRRGELEWLQHPPTFLR